MHRPPAERPGERAQGLSHGVAAVAHGAHQEALDSRAFRAEEEYVCSSLSALCSDRLFFQIALVCEIQILMILAFGCVVVTERGIYILYEDVKSCPCEDVQILWSILVESHPPPPLRLKQ